jgi:hypothetical protein
MGMLLALAAMIVAALVPFLRPAEAMGMPASPGMESVASAPAHQDAADDCLRHCLEQASDERGEAAVVPFPPALPLPADAPRRLAVDLASWRAALPPPPAARAGTRAERVKMQPRE